MPKWLPSFRRDGGGETPPPSVLELMVLEGVDAGQQFTVDGPDVLIGRGKPKTGQTGAIFLHDTTVSARQATIRLAKDGAAILEHAKGATNPTIVNGRRIRRQKIKPGDRIQMGRVLMEVRVRKGIALSGLFRVTNTDTEPLTVVGANASLEPARPQSAPGDTNSDLTEYRDTQSLLGSLLVVQGIEGLERERFRLGADATLVGRSADCNVTVPDPGISRRHCRLEWRGSELVLVHLSRTNETLVNGAPMSGEQVVADGDEIGLAGSIVLRVELGTRVAFEDRPTLPPPKARSRLRRGKAQRSLHEQMEEKLERDRLIEEEFTVDGSFVDVDVVGSYAMKAEAERPAHIIVSFERFRAFVESVINEFGGQVLNSNGDELMCFFDSTLEAVRSSSAILQRLDDFNEGENVLSSPFRFRIGVHTGRSLVDRARGVAYSPVLDVAGHLQKAADVNGLLVSEATMAVLPEGLPFEPAGTLSHEGIATFRMTAPID